MKKPLVDHIVRELELKLFNVLKAELNQIWPNDVELHSVIAEAVDDYLKCRDVLELVNEYPAIQEEALCIIRSFAPDEM